MIRLRFVASALIWLVGSVMQAQSLPSNGTVYASDFGQWNIPQGTSPTNGSIAWPSMSICRPASQGYTLNPLTVGRKIRILDNRPAASETVTVSATSNNVCSITTTAMATTHLSYSVASGTGGLQEAIDSASSLTGGLVVVLTPAWSVLGGTTDMITNASGNASVTILDQRVAKIVPYKWNGTNYVPDPFGGGGSGNVNPSPQYRITYYDQPGSQASVLGDVATTDANGGFTVTSLVGKFVSNLGMGKQLRSTNTSTDGCQNAYSVGSVSCIVEPGYTNDAGILPNTTSPAVRTLDTQYAGQAEVVQNAQAYGFGVPASNYDKRYFFYTDNKMADVPSLVGSRSQRPTGMEQYYNFMHSGRDENNAASGSQWSVGAGRNITVNTYGKGIRQLETTNMGAYSLGDIAGWHYGYLTYAGGSPEGSAEGYRGWAQHVTEQNGDVQTTLASVTGTTAVKLTLAGSTGYVSGNGTQGVGRYLVRKTAPIASGNITAAAYNGTYGLTAVTVNSTLTKSTWIGQGATNILPAINQDNPPLVTVTLTTAYSSDSSTLVNGDQVCIASTGSTSGEQVPISSLSVVGTSVTFQAPLRHGHQGNTTAARGNCMALDAVGLRLLTAASGSITQAMNAQMVVAVPDANTLLVGTWFLGSAQGIYASYMNALNKSCSGTISQSGFTVTATITSNPFCMQYFANNPNVTVSGTGGVFDGAVPNAPVFNGIVATSVLTWTSSTSTTIAAVAGTLTTSNTSQAFNLYPMAVIDGVCDPSVTTPPTFANRTPCLNGYLSLENNAVPWAAGDTVEIPHYNAMRANGGFLNMAQYTPSTIMSGLQMQLVGEGYGGAPAIDVLVSDTSYFGTGGRLNVPPVGFRLRGPNTNTILTNAPSVASNGTSSAVILVNCATPTGYQNGNNCAKTPEYYFASMGSTLGNFGMTFDPQTSNIGFLSVGVVKSNTSFRLWSANTSVGTARQPLVGNLFFDTTTNHAKVANNAASFGDLAYLSEVCTATQTGNCPAQTGNATTINGLAVPASSAYVGTNASRQFIAATTPLLPLNNLSDLGNVATARNNLGLGPFATQTNLTSTQVTTGLGYTPVQQGGGSGQLTNKIYIGWSGSALKAQVDSTDLGNVCMSTGSGCPAAASPAFSSITTGTNTSSTMTVGSGASLLHSGTGTIDATLLNGNTFQAPAPIGATTPNVGLFTNLNGLDFTVGSGTTHITNSDDICLNSGLHCSATAGVTYNDVTSSRAYATTYVNSTGHRIRVYWTGFDGGGSHAMLITAFVNGNEIADTNAGATTVGSKFTVSFDVGSGDNYQVTTTNSGGFTAASIGKVVEEQF